MKIEPNGRIPPSIMITRGSMNHFFSGIGLGTAFTRQGASGVPARFRPRIVPTKVNGKITNIQIHVTATWTNTELIIVVPTSVQDPQRILPRTHH